MTPLPPPTHSPILNTEGEDIGPALESAALGAAIPVELALACAMAESGLNPRAERWGTLTTRAQQALARGDSEELDRIIGEVWPDISFGYGQRIVAYHYLGDGSERLENCLTVREGVFGEPERDLRAMAEQLAECLAAARQSDLDPVGGDPLLGALVVYNAGHLPAPGNPWWREWAGNVANYRRTLARAREMFAG